MLKKSVQLDRGEELKERREERKQIEKQGNGRGLLGHIKKRA